MLKGKDLIADIDACQVSAGAFAFWWLGQHSFAVKLGSAVIYLDPYLTDHPDRQAPPLLRPDEATHADLVIGTHDHADHIDRPAWPALAAASPSAQFVVPELLRAELAETLGIRNERFIGLDDGCTAEVGDIRITGIAAAHEFIDRDEETGLHPYLGCVVEGNGCAVYHAGDTCVYEGLQTKLRQWRLDLALLPINGRDARRLAANCIGNMTYQEAADLAGALEPGLTIPTHYDMFATNSEDPMLFTEYMRVKYPHLETQVCGYGVRVTRAGRTAG